MSVQYIWGTGRRKTSVARVRVKPGAGEFKVNGRAFEEFFQTDAVRVVRDPAHDSIAWREYLEAVVRERPGWEEFYDACRELA